MINWDHLLAEQETYRAAFQRGEPFPHVVMDGLFTNAGEIAAAFEALRPTVHRKHLHSNKWTCDDPTTMPEAMRHALFALNSPHWLGYLSGITGLRPLYADWFFFGGGAHVSRRGGFLDVHADFQDHPTNRRRRVLNLLVYFNPEWRPEWRGALELWSPDMARPVQIIAPLLNRAVLFQTSATSFHGHPDPMLCPEDVERRSLAVYYYGPPEKTPGLKTTDYRPRKTDYLKRFRKLLGRQARAWGLR